MIWCCYKIKKFSVLFFFLIPLFMGSLSSHATETDQIRQMQKLQEQQKVDTRFADYVNKIRKSPKDPQAHLALAQVYLERNLLELAIESFRRVLILDSSIAQAHFGLSKTYRKKDLKKLEILEMELAVQKAPDNQNYRYELGVLYMEPANFDYKKAKKQYKALVKMESPLAQKLGTLMQIDS